MRIQRPRSGISDSVQVKAKAVHEHVEQMRVPVDTSYVHELLLDYATGIASELSRGRERLRRGRADSPEAEQLSFCLAIIELITEAILNPSAVVPGLLRWYSRHYLEGEEDVSDWYREAQNGEVDQATTPNGLKNQ